MAAALIAEEEAQKQVATSMVATWSSNISTWPPGKPRARKKPKSRGKASAEAGASGVARTCLAEGGEEEEEEGGAGVVGDPSSSHDGSQNQSHQFDNSS
eukprot:1608587-Pyramimonas_sp.AAC.1